MMRSLPFLLAVGLSCYACWVAALPSYTNRLPNGNAVPSPCNSAELWPGVGHRGQAGGGPRNPFGIDFKAEDFKWTPQLCRKDSDGDGRSNGEELGDPDCLWQPGATPSRTTGLSHPGICEPVNSEKCIGLNGDIKCPDQFNCPAIKEPGVRKMSMRMNRTAVPPKETTYMCQAYQVSTLDKEHMIASVPVIDNPGVLHHMIIYGCNSKPNIELNKPIECGMSAGNCFNLIDLWGLGMRPGNCYRDNVGAPFGLQGYQYVVLQLHWNNPTGITNWVDGSGFELYFSPTPRPYDSGVLMYGQVKLDLAPRQTEIYRTATCDARCTQALLPPTGYKLLWGTLHMHLYGVRGQVTQWRGGQKVRDLIPMHNFDYDTPVVFEYNPPVDYMPGDELKTDCYYSTVKTNRSVFWGESTQEEMCYGFFQYFPFNRTKSMSWPNVDLCTSFGKVDYCTVSLTSVDKYVIDQCDLREVTSGRLRLKYADQLEKECRHSYRYRCSDQCLAWYREVKKVEPCLQGDVLDYVTIGARGNQNNLRELIAYWDLCTERNEREMLSEAKAKIDELLNRPTQAPPTADNLLKNFDVRLLIVSGSYLAGLLLAGILLLVILKMRKNTNRVDELSIKSSRSSRI